MKTNNYALTKLLVTSLLGFVVSCATSPTGRSQFIVFSSEQMSELGQDSFSQLKSESNISKSYNYDRYVGCISSQLLAVIDENPNDWEVVVFIDDSLNAFALPGKKIGIHTGMIQFASRDELAAVIGHEVAHVKARHGAERMSMGLTNQALIASSALILEDSKYAKHSGIAVAVLAVGSQYGILLPYSRTHELEADAMGLAFLAQAGFNPDAAISLWKKMQKNANHTPLAFVSTHPSHTTRIDNLSTQLYSVGGIYQRNKINAGVCSKSKYLMSHG